MFKAKILGESEEDVVLELESESRSLMRSFKLLCEENGIECEVTEEVKPRPVKFKGVD